MIPYIAKMPLARIKVRGLVKYKNDYLFIRRTYHGRSRSFLVCPGGRVEKNDVQYTNGYKDLELTLRFALERELKEELFATGIEIQNYLTVSRLYNHYREVLFNVNIENYDWENKTGSEFSNPNTGDYELVKIRHLDRRTLGRRGYRFEPKEWRKLIPSYALG